MPRFPRYNQSQVDYPPLWRTLRTALTSTFPSGTLCDNGSRISISLQELYNHIPNIAEVRTHIFASKVSYIVAALQELGYAVDANNSRLSTRKVSFHVDALNSHVWRRLCPDIQMEEIQVTPPRQTRRRSLDHTHAQQPLTELRAPQPPTPWTQRLQSQEATHRLQETKDFLQKAAEGDKPDISFQDLPSVKAAYQFFVDKQFDQILLGCNVCNEVNIVDSKRFGNGLCSRCKNERADSHNFNSDNNMDPYHHPLPRALSDLKTLPELNEIEMMFIAQYQPIMTIYRLKNGQYGFEGNVINVAQDIKPICEVLPRLPSDVSIVFIRRRISNENENQYRDFKIRRSAIVMWLRFLKQYNKWYHHIVISDANINAIPDVPGGVPAMELCPSQIIGNPNVDDDNDDDDDIVDGPDADDPDNASEDGGIEDGPVPREPEEENILYTGLQNLRPNNRAEEDHINDAIEHAADGRTILPWHAGGDVASEFNTPGILAKTFPCLFPYGYGDVTDKVGRRHDVTNKDAFIHYMRYAIKNNNLYRPFSFPFAKNPRFCHYIQNMDERHRIYSQAAFYVNQATDKSITREDLEAIRLNPAAIFQFQAKMSRYAANIIGSAPYFYARRKELEALLEQQGIPTIWFTLSFPDYHLDDLHRLFGERDPNMSEEAYRKWKATNLKENPGLVDEFFTIRVNAFLKETFGPNILDSDWTWYRHEWQKRKSIHTHGLAKLKSDPGIYLLGQKVYKGRLAGRELRAYDIIAGRFHLHLPGIIHEDPENVGSDFFLQSFKDKLKAIQENKEIHPDSWDLSEDKRQALVRDIREGDIAEKRIVSYRDYILSSINVMDPLPVDADLDLRSDILQDQSIQHPSSCCHHDKKFNLNMIASLIEFCLRHRCYQDYCLAKGECRFVFPRFINDRTRVQVQEKPWQRGEKKGSLRKIDIKIIPETNDRWLNSYFPPGLAAWGGNIDFTLLIDKHAIIQYIAKYGTKTEENSNGFNAIFKKVCRLGRDNESHGTTMVKSLFTKVCGGRELGMQETAHLVLSLPLVKSSVSFFNVNLKNLSRRIELAEHGPILNDNADNDDEVDEIEHNRRRNLLVMTIIDAYGERLSEAKWDPQAYASATNLQDMTLSHFCSHYYVVRSGRRKNLICENINKPVCVFSPNISKSNTTADDQHEYYYYTLMKYKPWQGWPQTLYEGIEFDDIDKAFKKPHVKLILTTAWNDFILNCNLQEQPDHIATMVDAIRNSDQRDEWTPNPQCDDIIRQTEGRLDDEDIDMEDYMNICRTCLLGNRATIADDAADRVPEWAQDHDWYSFRNTYIHFEDNNAVDYSCFTAEKLMLFWNQPTIPAVERRQVHRQQLKERQRYFYDLVVNLAERYNDPVFLPENFEHLFLLLGAAGCGKSYVIDALTTTYGNKVIVAAFSGKAACNIGGTTLHASKGLHLPVTEDQEKELKGDALKLLQAYCKGKLIVIIDEFTMLSQKLLFWLDSRLRQGACKPDVPFGGFITILAGDPGQLPPVAGSVLWNDKPVGRANTYGYFLYKNFKKCIKLNGSNRLDPNCPEKDNFERFLNQLREGQVTVDSWEWFNSIVTKQAIINRIGASEYARKFESNDSTWFFCTNKELLKHNMEQLVKTSEPIARIDATNTPLTAKRGNKDQARNLENTLYLSVNSKVLCTWNLRQDFGIVNGSTGIVKDIIYDRESDNKPPNVPLCVVVDFQDYKGPPYFQGDDKRTWIPICPKLAEWYHGTESFKRQQLPLKLTWAFTPWKSQGSTFPTPVGVDIPDKEMSPGLTYVNVSRSTSIYNITVLGGVSLERLTTDISKGKAFQKRLLEENRLDALSESTINTYRLLLDQM